MALQYFGTKNLECVSVLRVEALGEPVVLGNHLTTFHRIMVISSSKLLASDSHVLAGVNASTNILSGKKNQKKHSKRPQEIILPKKLIVSSFG